MADDSIIIRFGLDDSTFQSAISRMNRSLRLAQSEFSLASSRLSNFGSSSESLRLRINNLNRQVEIQRELVDTLNRRYQESVRATGENSRATENLRIRLNNATAQLNNMQRELNVTSSRWNQVSESMEKAGTKMKAVGDKMSAIGSSLTAYVTLPILGAGAAATKMAMDAVESENLFEVAMGKMAGEARKWSVETSKALGLNEYNVRKNMATYNAMLTSMGLTSQESLKMSESLTQLSYDMASFYNLNPEEAFLKLRAGISGEAEPLKALGILVNETTTQTYAYTNGIAKQGAKLTEVQKVQARYGVILQATKNAQSDLARTMDSPTNKLRIMKEQVTQIGIQFGQLLIPILEKLMNIIKPLLDKFQGLSKGQQEMIVKIGLVVAAIGPVFLIVGKVITIIGTLVTVISTISGSIASAGGVTAALGAAFAAITSPVGIAIAVIVALVAAVAGLVAMFVALYKNNAEFRNNVSAVWQQIKTAISSVIESLKVLIHEFVVVAKKLWQEYGDDIVKIATKAFNLVAVYVNSALKVLKDIINVATSLIKGDWQGAWEGIKIWAADWAQGLCNIIKAYLDLLSSVFKLVFEGIKSLIMQIWEGIKLITSVEWGVIMNVINTVMAAIKDFIFTVLEYIVNDVSAKWNVVKSTTTFVWDAIANFFRSLWANISSIFNNTLNTIINVVTNIWNGLLGTTTNIWNGIKYAITSPINAAVNFVGDEINRIRNFFASLHISIPAIKLPHFTIRGGFSLSPPSVPNFGVNWYASGGIFNRPSIIGVGEAGTEAVIPIDKLEGIIRKAMQKAKGGEGISLNIQNFINNTERDIERLMYEIDFYQQRIANGRGSF